MLKKTDELFNLIKIKDQKEDLNKVLEFVIFTIKEEVGIEFKKDNFLVKNNNIKIKTSSNNKFVLMLFLDVLKNKIALSYPDIIVEL